MIAGYLGLPVSYPFLCETKTGTSLYLEDRADLATAWIIFLRREYTVDPADEIIVDCGANIGVFTLYAAARAPRAHLFAVEPFPSTFHKLQENVRRNQLGNRITCLPIALAACDGMVNMYAAAEVPSHLRQVIKPSGADTVSVPASSLSSLIQRMGTSNVDLLKIDIEGSEHPALLAAGPPAFSSVQRLSVEYHQTGDKDALFSHLKAAGFELCRDRVLGHNYGVAEFVGPLHRTSCSPR
jgi:FkbM family methyltransferase